MSFPWWTLPGLYRGDVDVDVDEDHHPFAPTGVESKQGPLKIAISCQFFAITILRTEVLAMTDFPAFRSRS